MEKFGLAKTEPGKTVVVQLLAQMQPLLTLLALHGLFQSKQVDQLDPRPLASILAKELLLIQLLPTSSAWYPRTCPSRTASAHRRARRRRTTSMLLFGLAPTQERVDHSAVYSSLQICGGAK